MCKKLFKALKIKMDNFHLKYELAGADETISQLKQQLAEKDAEIEDYKKMHWNMQYQHLQELDELSKLTAITELNNILDTFAFFVNAEKESIVSPDGNGNLSLLEYIENRIDTLKGDTKC